MLKLKKIGLARSNVSQIPGDNFLESWHKRRPKRRATGKVIVMSALEKLLLRRARNTDLARSAQWLANIAYVALGLAETPTPVAITQTLEFYGEYAETEDPEALVNAENELLRAIEKDTTRDEIEDIVVG